MDRLARYLGDHLEISVVVEHLDAGALGCRGDEQVGDLDLLVTIGAEVSEHSLHVDRPPPFDRCYRAGVERA